MVRVITKNKLTKITTWGVGDLSNHTITRKINKHERILENPSF